MATSTTKKREKGIATTTIPRSWMSASFTICYFGYRQSNLITRIQVTLFCLELLTSTMRHKHTHIHNCIHTIVLYWLPTPKIGPSLPILVLCLRHCYFRLLFFVFFLFIHSAAAATAAVCLLEFRFASWQIKSLYDSIQSVVFLPSAALRFQYRHTHL